MRRDGFAMAGKYCVNYIDGVGSFGVGFARLHCQKYKAAKLKHMADPG
jgi:hypothetical protein